MWPCTVHAQCAWLMWRSQSSPWRSSLCQLTTSLHGPSVPTSCCMTSCAALRTTTIAMQRTVGIIRNRSTRTGKDLPAPGWERVLSHFPLTACPALTWFDVLGMLATWHAWGLECCIAVCLRFHRQSDWLKGGAPGAAPGQTLYTKSRSGCGSIVEQIGLRGRCLSSPRPSKPAPAD